MAYKVRETGKYKELTQMFKENGLEVDPNAPPPIGLIQCWEAVDLDENIIGGITLEKRNDCFVISGITVLEKYRKEYLGSLLVQILIEKTRILGGEKLYLVAKVPTFFATLGFEPIELKNAPKISKCFTCQQFNQTCFPQVMELNLI